MCRLKFCTHEMKGPETKQRRKELGNLSELLAKVLARMQPVVTSVNPLNRAAMAVRLVKRGFRPTGAAGSETRFRWDPGTLG